MNRFLLEKVWCLLFNASLDKMFWAKALVYASHLTNCLSSTAIGCNTPLDIWSGRAAQDFDLLRIFGCPAYFSAKDDKINPRSKKFVFWVSREI